ncbi:hypothetical protein D6C81_03453 [Aureobasidium pullulans]|nr:hypothetical protein D6C81_03453 [Aureobasidium pullulans]
MVTNSDNLLEYHGVSIIPFAEQIIVLLFETIYHFVLDFSNNDHPFTTDRNFANCLLRIARDVFRSLEDILLHLGKSKL